MFVSSQKVVGLARFILTSQISSGEALSGLEANPVIIEMVSLTMSSNVDAALCDTIEGV